MKHRPAGDRTDSRITLHPGENSGTVRDLLAVNNGPTVGRDLFDTPYIDASGIFTELGISLVRLHDTEYPYGGDTYIDIHCIFPDFSADVNDPASYRFGPSDELVGSVLATGARILFRLGESIDDLHVPGICHIQPPENFEKWAEICVRIVGHYREQFGDGVAYWEIWNEPDMPTMWTGTMEEYYRLYRVTATKLKAAFPEIMVGGPALSTCNRETVTAFFRGLTEDGITAPIDFFSCHLYADSPEKYTAFSDMIAASLAEAGYPSLPVFLDEWNYVGDWTALAGTFRTISSQKGASFALGTLLTLRKSIFTRAFYYDAQLADFWCGLYAKAYAGVLMASSGSLMTVYATGGAPAFRRALAALLAPYRETPLQILPTYYALLAYRRLLVRGRETALSVEGDDIYAAAASDGSGTTVVATNYSDTPKTLLFAFPGAFREATVTCTDGDGTTTKIITAAVDAIVPVSLGAYGIVTVELS